MAEEGTTLQINCRRRLAHLATIRLGTTWESICTGAGETPVNVRGWVARGSMTISSLERVGHVLGVPPYALLDPDFDPRAYPPPGHLGEGIGGDE